MIGGTIPEDQKAERGPIQQSPSQDSADHIRIPGMMGFRSAHTLINKERVKRGRPSLKRSKYLDLICQLHAEAMAEYQQLAHAVDTADELKSLVNSEHAGENIQRGPSVEEMHVEAMRARRSAYKNILGQNYREFGVGTCKGKDDKLYMVQLFRGEESIKGLGKEYENENGQGGGEEAAAAAAMAAASEPKTVTVPKPGMIQRAKSRGEEVLDHGVDIPAMLVRAKSLTETEGDIINEAGHGIEINSGDVIASANVGTTAEL